MTHLTPSRLANDEEVTYELNSGKKKTFAKSHFFDRWIHGKIWPLFALFRSLIADGPSRLLASPEAYEHVVIYTDIIRR